MAQDHIVTTIQRKINETEARLADYRRFQEDGQKDLVHLRGAIALFQRDKSGVPSTPHVSLTGVFKRGEAFAICKQALQRNPEGVDTRSLAAACLESKDLDPEDKLIRRSMMQTIAQMMQIHKNQGVVEIVAKNGKVCVWRLARR